MKERLLDVVDAIWNPAFPVYLLLFVSTLIMLCYEGWGIVDKHVAMPLTVQAEPVIQTAEAAKGRDQGPAVMANCSEKTRYAFCYPK